MLSLMIYRLQLLVIRGYPHKKFKTRRTVTDNNHITSIGKYAFDGCSLLLDIINTNQMTSIQESTFQNCFSLSDITIPNGIQSIG